MKKTIFLVVITLFLAGSISTADCFRTDDSAVTYFQDCACEACAYTGPGCTVCSNGSNTCYTDGASCEPFQLTP